MTLKHGTTLILLLIHAECGLISSLADWQGRGARLGETQLNGAFRPFHVATGTQDQLNRGPINARLSPNATSLVIPRSQWDLTDDVTPL